MAELSLKRKIFLGVGIWLVLMLVLLIILLIRRQYLASQTRRLQQLATEDLNYQQQSAVLLQEALELENFRETLVLPQVDISFRLEQ